VMTHTDIVADYRQLRSEGVALSSDLIKTLKSDDIGAAASALGILKGREILLDTEDQAGVLMDYALFDIWHDGRNAVQRYWEQTNPPPESARGRLLEAMVRAQYTILKVTQPLPGVGVMARDLIRNEEKLLIDLGFSQTAVAGAVLASRIFSPGEGWWMTGGAGLPVLPEAFDRLVTPMAQYMLGYAGKRDEERSAFNTLVIRTCLESGAGQRINYATAGTLGAGGRPIKVGRNEPCPCGSGRKYKKCCGRGR
jgi:hypothetical protein